MNRDETAMINVVEAAYDLDVAVGDWLPSLNAEAKPLCDLGLGFYSVLLGGRDTDGQHRITQLHLGAGPEDLLSGVFQGALVAGPDLVSRFSEALLDRGVVTMSDLEDQWPDAIRILTKYANCKDGLALTAVDPDVYGVSTIVLSPKRLQLTPRARERWRMLAIHMTAGYRLRRKLIESAHVEGATSLNMPLSAEALIDPKRFLVSEAAGRAQERSVSEQIREAAVRVDRARGRLRRRNPEEALQIWHGLVRGRWSLVDWFDTDGRRFVLAKPNAPHLGDPRGLSEREHQVATYAARGESNKLIAYRFGLSDQRVSTVLRSAMRKLGTKTRAQLVDRMRGFPSAVGGDVDEQDAAS